MRALVRRQWPVLLVLLGPLALFGPMLVRGEALFWGTPLLQFVPWREYALELLRQGGLPLWNPLLGMGAPLLANYQSALLYPPNFLLAFVDVAWGHGLLVLLHLAWAGWGMVLLTRELGLPRMSQALAGIAFSLSGYLVARSGFLSINATAAWLPWLILAVERLVTQCRERRVPRVLPWLAIVLALQWLAGHAQTAWYALLLALV